MRFFNVIQPLYVCVFVCLCFHANRMIQYSRVQYCAGKVQCSPGAVGRMHDTVVS